MSRTLDAIVPCYNYGSYLARCVRSILEQPRVSVRVLILDDCSSDNTPEVGLALARTDDRVIFRRHERNHGHIATYNEGFEWASADYVLLISADDLLAPRALARAIDLMESDPGVVFVHGRQVVFRDQPILPEPPRGDRPSTTGGLAFIEGVCRLAHNPVATPTVVVRNSAQRAAGAYDPSLPHTADMAMWLELAALGDVGFIDGYQAFKRQHGQNMQLSFTLAAESDFRERHKALRTFFLRGRGRALPNADALLCGAERSLALQLVDHAARLFDLGHTQPAQDVLALAAEIDHGVRHTGGWHRMTLKLALGLRMCEVLKRLAGRPRELARS